MINENNIPNGGFPPIKKYNIIKENTREFQKERLAPSYKTNIKIQNILNTNIKKPIILEDLNEIEIIEEV